MARKKSLIWNYYKPVDKGAKCNECNALLKCTDGSTSGLYQHLNRHLKVKKEFEEAKDALEKEKEVKNQSKKRSYLESFLDAMVTPTIKDAFEKSKT